MICFNKSLNEKIQSNQSESFPDPEKNKHLLQIIDGACSNAESPEKEREYLEAGLKFTQLTAKELADQAAFLGLPELAKDYLVYHREQHYL